MYWVADNITKLLSTFLVVMMALGVIGNVTIFRRYKLMYLKVCACADIHNFPAQSLSKIHAYTHTHTHTEQMAK